MTGRWARAIKTARKRAGLTQEQLAPLLGVTMITISRWERGTHEPKEITKEGVLMRIRKVRRQK